MQRSTIINSRPSAARTGAVRTQALFGLNKLSAGRTTKVVEEAPKKGSKSVSSKTATKTATKTVSKTAAKPAEPPRRKESFFSQTINALDFAEARSKKDAELLYEAKYGELKDGKMTREQYGALRRKIGGTYKSFFKESVDVVGDYTDKGYVAKGKSGASDTSSGALLLGGVTLGLVSVALFAVLSQ